MANFTPQEIEEMLQAFFDTVGKRQYVGARYVPLFGRKGESSIDWDNTKPYEPLTIVLYEGNSYTSRTYVPAGVEIDDEYYWALTGAYNAQVEAYRREVLQLEEDWGTWKVQAIHDLEEAIAPVTTIIPSSAFTNESTVKDYIDKRSLFAGANVMCITDSWGSETAAYGVTTCWMHIVCNILKANYIDLHQGSTGFVRAPTFLTRAQAYAENNPDMVDKINAIIICGGNNDVFNTTSEFYTAIQNTISYLLTTYINAVIYYVPQISGIDMNKCSVASNDYNAWQKAAYQSYRFLLNIETAQRLVFVKSMQYCLVGRPDAWMNTDFIHPKQVAHNYMAQVFINTILNTDQNWFLYSDSLSMTDNHDNGLSLSSTVYRAILFGNGTLRVTGNCDITIADATGISYFKIPLPKLRSINVQNYTTKGGLAIFTSGASNLATSNCVATIATFQQAAEKTLGPSDETETTMWVRIQPPSGQIVAGTHTLAFDLEFNLTY